MKRYAGEHGSCFASGRTLRKKLGVGIKAYNTSLKYLLEHEWIYYKGNQMVETSGGPQMVKVYGIKDLWKQNNDHYNKGVSKRTPLRKVVSKALKGVPESRKGVVESAPKKNITRTIEEESFLKMKTEMHKKFKII